MKGSGTLLNQHCSITLTTELVPNSDLISWVFCQLINIDKRHLVLGSREGRFFRVFELNSPRTHVFTFWQILFIRHYILYFTDRALVHNVSITQFHNRIVVCGSIIRDNLYCGVVRIYWVKFPNIFVFCDFRY